jgi:hypothetical protein
VHYPGKSLSRRSLLGLVPLAGAGVALAWSAPAFAAAAEAVAGDKGIDYAWSRPALSAVVSGGYKFVVRYVSWDTTGKNLTASEANSLIAAGLNIVLCWEYQADEVLSGYAKGAQSATEAARQASACGMPSDRPIYFCIDFDATAAQQAAINSYFDGVASVIGRDRTGIYGGYDQVKRTLDAGKATWAWQTYAWSSGQWDSRAQLRQIQNAVTVGGASCDIDQAKADDFGQWPAPQVAAPVIASRYFVYGGLPQYFARSSTGTLGHWYYSKGWVYQDLGGDLAGQPMAYVYEPYDQINVFGRTSSGFLRQWTFTPTGGWKNGDVRHDVASGITGDPAGYTYPDWRQQHIYVRNAGSRLLHVIWDPSNGWSTELLGTNVDGNPAVYQYPAWNQQQVAFRTTDQHLMLYTYAYSTGWTLSDVASDVVGDPAAYIYPDFGQQHVLARVTTGELVRWQYDYATGFKRYGTGLQIDGSAAAYIIPAWQQQQVVVRNAQDDLIELTYTYGSGWTQRDLGSKATGDPVVLPNPGTGQQHIFAPTGPATHVHITWDSKRGWYTETLKES